MNICKYSRMSKLKIIPLFLVILLFLTSCKKTADARDAIDARIEAIKDSASVVEAILPVDANASVPGQEGQTVYVSAPQHPQQIYQNTNKFSADYRAACKLERFKFLNIYCSAKTYWQQQSEIISWRISYSWVLLGLVVALIALWWIGRKLRG